MVARVDPREAHHHQQNDDSDHQQPANADSVQALVAEIGQKPKNRGEGGQVPAGKAGKLNRTHYPDKIARWPRLADEVLQQQVQAAAAERGQRLCHRGPPCAQREHSDDDEPEEHIALRREAQPTHRAQNSVQPV